jgi:hypothetical protein
MRLSKRGEKFVPIYPPFELGVKGITAILVQDGLGFAPEDLFIVSQQLCHG